MHSVILKFYVTEKQQHRGVLLYEWLLRLAQGMHLPGASAFRAIAGYGRHGHLHEDRFFELAGELSISVEFVLDADDADRLLAAVTAEKLQLHYVRYAVESASTGA